MIMEKVHNNESQQNKERERNERQDQVNKSMYVEFSDAFLDLNPDHCLNSENAERRK